MAINPITHTPQISIALLFVADHLSQRLSFSNPQAQRLRQHAIHRRGFNQGHHFEVALRSDRDDVRRVAGRIGAHGLADDVIELDLAIVDMDAIIESIELLHQIGRGLDILVQRPDGDRRIFGIGGNGQGRC